MGAKAHKFARDAGASGALRDEVDGQDLPEVPPNILLRIFQCLLPRERDLVLRHRLLPIAILPHTTLYADAAPERDRQDLGDEAKIVARVCKRKFWAHTQSTLGSALEWEASQHLRLSRPAFSAHQRFYIGQLIFLVLLASVVVYAYLNLAFSVVETVFSYVFCGLFGVMVWTRLAGMIYQPAQARDLPEHNDASLPIYSVLVPIFKETEVLPQLIGALRHLNYPTEKLDIKLIVEEKDLKMRRAIEWLDLPRTMEVVVVPCGKLQTKPRALNYAMQFARGELVTIYDAEDIPDPMQLRVAARAFARRGSKVACLQAELAFYNSNENWLTRQFTVEYATLFRLVLPWLAHRNVPMPLGGTSNHFREAALREAGGWDPYNVTEDADLGFRLARLGFQTGTIASTTHEEANVELRNWLFQRARWQKGFLQTWLVHMRHPIRLIEEVGFRGFLSLQANILGVVATAVLHPWFLGQVIYRLATGKLLAAGSLGLFASSLLPLEFMIAGAVIVIVAGHEALRRKRIHHWWLTLATMPAYWFLAGLAGLIALWQFAVEPFSWNKTRHGLSKLTKPDVSLRRTKLRP